MSTDVPDIPQSEVIDAHRRCRRVLPSAAAAEPYEVRFVDAGHQGEPDFPRRWAPANHATPTQLREYWSALGPGAASEAAFHAASSARSDLNATSCATRKESTVSRTRCARSAGWLFACTPAGFIVHMKEFYGAESLGQRYVFLGELFEATAGTTTTADTMAFTACSPRTAACSSPRALPM